MANKKPPQKNVEASYSYEGGDSFELFNYLKYMITENCDVSVSILEKENKKS